MAEQALGMMARQLSACKVNVSSSLWKIFFIHNIVKKKELFQSQNVLLKSISGCFSEASSHSENGIAYFIDFVLRELWQEHDSGMIALTSKQSKSVVGIPGWFEELLILDG